METFTVMVGDLVVGNGGITNDTRQKVQFTGEKLGSYTEYGTDRHGRITDTRGTTETLYRTEDGQLVVHIDDWSRWEGEPGSETLRRVREEDLHPGGPYTHLGAACGFGRPLTLVEAVSPIDGGSEASSAWLASHWFRTWPEEARDALGCWLGRAARRAGITDKATGIRLLHELQGLFDGGELIAAIEGEADEPLGSGYFFSVPEAAKEDEIFTTIDELLAFVHDSIHDRNLDSPTLEQLQVGLQAVINGKFGAAV